jgi:hypothetical protein
MQVLQINQNPEQDNYVADSISNKIVYCISIQQLNMVEIKAQSPVFTIHALFYNLKQSECIDKSLIGEFSNISWEICKSMELV